MKMILFCHILKEMPNSAGFGAFNQVLSSGGSMAEARKAASEAAKSDGASSEPQYEVNVKEIFQDISSLNPTRNEMSSLGEYVTESARQISDKTKIEILNKLPESSLAYKILKQNYDSVKDYDLSDKQKWVIAYELQKNNSYTQTLGEKIARRNSAEKRKSDASKAKKAANKSASQPLLNQIKSKGLKLGDYYKWLNTKGNKYRSEYFSKKYSSASVSAFLNR